MYTLKISAGSTLTANCARLITRTNTSAQVRHREIAADTAVDIDCFTVGWIDDRGRWD